MTLLSLSVRIEYTGSSHLMPRPARSELGSHYPPTLPLHLVHPVSTREPLQLHFVACVEAELTGSLGEFL